MTALRSMSARGRLFDLFPIGNTLNLKSPWLLTALLLLCLPAARAAPIRNVILCIGDGMGPEQIKAARCYAGTNLFFESFPFISEMTTHAVDGSTTDSAAASTAMATGTKVDKYVISLRIPGDGGELETLLEYFKNKDICGVSVLRLLLPGPPRSIFSAGSVRSSFCSQYRHAF